MLNSVPGTKFHAYTAGHLIHVLCTFKIMELYFSLFNCANPCRNVYLVFKAAPVLTFSSIAAGGHSTRFCRALPCAPLSHPSPLEPFATARAKQSSFLQGYEARCKACAVSSRRYSTACISRCNCMREFWTGANDNKLFGIICPHCRTEAENLGDCIQEVNLVTNLTQGSRAFLTHKETQCFIKE